jgi:hypothetical protein
VSDICALRPQVDVLILQLHWGWEFSFYPLLSYRDRARRFAGFPIWYSAITLAVGLRYGSSIIAHGLGTSFPSRRALIADTGPTARMC